MPSSTTRSNLPYPLGTDPAGDADLVIKSLAQNLDTRLNVVDMPGAVGRRAYNLCLFSAAISNGTGYIIIQTNIAVNSTVMTTLNITGYCYEPDNNTINTSISFYPYTDSSIHNAEITNNGSFHFSNVQILSRNSDGKVAIALTSGAPNSYWNYPKLAVDGIFGHTAVADSDLTTGWKIFRAANLSGYTSKVTPLTPRGAAEDTGWITPTLLNGWTQYNDTDWPVRYRRKGGLVYIRGLTIPPATTTSVIMNMPGGFRPKNETLRGAVDSGMLYKQVYVNQNGNVSSSNGSSAGWLSLEGITYPAEL